MHFPILAVAVLFTLTVLMHATGFALVLRGLMKHASAPPTQLWPITWLLVRAAWWLFLLHCAEITLWAFAYLWAGCLPDAESAFYFSGVT